MKKTPYFDRKYLGRVGLSIAAFVLAAASVIYIGYHMSSSVKEGLDIIYATSEVIPRTVSCESYILREESVISGSVTAGALTPTAHDGERVRKGSKVADIYSTASPVVQEKISLLEDQIAFYKKCAENHISVGDTSSVNKSLSSYVLRISRDMAGGNISGALAVRNNTILDVRRLGVLTGKVTDFSTVIAALESEIASLRSSLGSVSSSVFAPESGYYFSEIDGYEDIFAINSIDSLTYSKFNEMVNSASAVTPRTDNSLGKIVQDFRWYVACRMSSTDAASFEKDKSYSVTLENNQSTPLDMTVNSVLSNGTDSVVIFRSTRFPDGYDYTRCQEATLVKSSFTGFRIPTSALRVHEGMEGVFILDEVTVDFRRVSVVGEAGNYFLCEVVTEEILEIPEDTTDSTAEETTAATEEESRYYPYLKENDIVITSGTGLYVGMTYQAN